MLDLLLIINSIFLILVLLLTYFSIGIVFKITTRILIGKEIYFSVFKTVLYGLLILVFFYVLIKSTYLLNSVSVTCLPILIFFYERSMSINGVIPKANNENWIKFSLLGFLGFLIFYLAKYLFHFSSQINTGYSDQAFYHTIASSLKFTGVETVNIHTGELQLIPGMIYHYWDLWFLAFHYDFLSILNQLGLFESFNQFEINILVFQPSLFLILFIGFIEVSLMTITRNFSILKFRISIIVIISLLVLSHSFLEFGIIHHPKQFLIASIFVYFILEILQNKIRTIDFFYFYPILLFSYPLPGAVLIATCFLFSINWENIAANFSERKFYYDVISVLTTCCLFILYYFFYAQTCIPQLYSQNKPPWSLLTAVSRIFIYHGYHTMISPLGVFICLNLLILLFIFKGRIFSNNISRDCFKYLLMFSILNILVGHFLSAIMYNVPEEFQFYNNDYFSLALILLLDTIFLFYHLRKKLILPFSICFTSFFYFINTSFYNKPNFYKGISMSYNNYFTLKSKKFNKDIPVQIDDNLDVLYSFSDIIPSFHNSYSRHKKNICLN